MAPLEILTVRLGSIDNNAFLLVDLTTQEAVVIDPSFESEMILAAVNERGWTLKAIWLTHAHFDHIAGVKLLSESTQPPLPVGLHPADLSLYREAGGARTFGAYIEQGPEPTLLFEHGQVLSIGQSRVEVRHTPGHTPGHVVFYLPEQRTVLCGDLIFFRSVGRTDLPGASHATLIKSIREQIFTLPGETHLLCGHGPETSVAEEMAENPYL